MRITMFGAESTGKTTLSHEINKWLNKTGHNSVWVPDFARRYLLDLDSPVLDVVHMHDIWEGQLLAQTQEDASYIIQDTDLYSTYGYWKFWQPETVPPGLRMDAWLNKSDLYIITQSNIPFEEDSIRYGGEKRESTDQYWIDLCETNNLEYVVLKSSELGDRVFEVMEAIDFYETTM